MLKVFIGYDPRQPISYNVLQHSIATRSTKPVSITPLIIEQLPITRVGLTPFTFTRFLVPWLCDYEGWALFLDLDMLVLDDISKLFDMADEQHQVLVSKNPKRFEWASAMLFNCPKCRILTPEYVQTAKGLHTIEWAESVGDMPPEWNHLVGYDASREDAKLIHYTQGIPAFPETKGCEYADMWFKEHRIVNSAVPWVELMGNSVHAEIVDGKPRPKLALQA